MVVVIVAGSSLVLVCVRVRMRIVRLVVVWWSAVVMRTCFPCKYIPMFLGMPKPTDIPVSQEITLQPIPAGPPLPVIHIF